MRFVDTNVFIRYFTSDSPSMSASSGRFLTRVADGRERAFLTEMVIAEIVYVLSGATYRVDRQGIVDRILSVLAFKGLQVPERDIIRRALEIYARYPQLDYEDASAVAQMERHGMTEIFSFDHGFDRVPGIRRIEP
jgi:predicted nucleic acid-binding protein